MVRVPPRASDLPARRQIHDHGGVSRAVHHPGRPACHPKPWDTYGIAAGDAGERLEVLCFLLTSLHWGPGVEPQAGTSKDGAPTRLLRA